MYISKFDESNLIFWEVRVSVYSSLNNVLHKILDVDPVIILNILFRFLENYFILEPDVSRIRYHIR
jgi:hypothetical protein